LEKREGKKERKEGKKEKEVSFRHLRQRQPGDSDER
jgi:hypothetical protein